MKTLGLFLLLVVSGCALGSDVEPTHYRLDPNMTSADMHFRQRGYNILHVAQPSASADSSGTAIQVEEADGRVTFVKNAVWIDAPAQMIEPFLVQGLENSGIFSAVVGDNTTADATLELQTSLERFAFVKTAGDASNHVEIALRYTLTKVADNRLVTSGLLRVNETVGETRMGTIIEAFQKAVQHTLADMASDLNKALKKA